MLRSINSRRLYLLFLISIFLVLTVEATEYTIRPAPNDQFGVSVAGEKVQIIEDTVIPYWQFLLWLAAMHILSMIDILLNPTKIIFLILGFRITESTDVLDNPSRNCVYTYIKTNPGTFLGEIVKNTGLNRGTALYHITVLKAKNKIEGYEDGGKTRYFQNNSTYSEKEKKLLRPFKIKLIKE